MKLWWLYLAIVLVIIVVVLFVMRGRQSKSK